MLAVFVASVLTVAAVQDTTTGIPGTSLRFGAESARFGAAQGFHPTARGARAGEMRREGDMRFFGIDAHATLAFVDHRLVRAEFVIAKASPHEIAYLEDDLTRRGYHRGCMRLDPKNSDCTWTGAATIHIVRQDARISATVLPPGQSPEPVAARRTQRTPPPPAQGSQAGAGGAMALANRMAQPEPADRAGGTSTGEAAPPHHLVSVPGVGAVHPDTLTLPVGWRTERFLLEASPPPAYPESARKAGVQGIVRTLALVDSTGAVHDVRILRGIAELDSAAIAVVRVMRFRPRTYDGRAVGSWIRVPVTFTLHGS